MSKKNVFLVIGIVLFCVIGIILSFFIIFQNKPKENKNISVINENVVNVLDATCGSGKILDARIENGKISLVDGINLIESKVTDAKAIYAISTDNCVKDHLLYIKNDGSLHYILVNSQSNIFTDDVLVTNGSYVGFIKELIKNDGKYIRLLTSDNEIEDILIIKY